MKKRVLVVGATKETTFSVHRKCLLYILFYLLASNPWHMFFREQFFEQFLDGEYISYDNSLYSYLPAKGGQLCRGKNKNKSKQANRASQS